MIKVLMLASVLGLFVAPLQACSHPTPNETQAAVQQVQSWQLEINSMTERLCSPKSELPPDAKVCGSQAPYPSSPASKQKRSLEQQKTN